MFRSKRSATLVVAAGVALFGPATAWSTDNFTWNGLARSGSGLWSDPGNWAGGVAPNGLVGTVTFPAIPGSSRTGGCGPGVARCTIPVDDIGGLTASGISIDSATPYSFGFTLPLATLRLGGAGFTISDHGRVEFPNPIALDAPQTWTLSGRLSLPSITGAAEPLGIDFRGGSRRLSSGGLEISSRAEVGPVSATGHGLIVLDDRASLNGADGSPVSLAAKAELDAPARGSAGPLTARGSSIVIGSGFGRTPVGSLSIGGTGNVAFDSGSSLNLNVQRAGTAPGNDFSQLRAAGTVALGGAYLNLFGKDELSCPKLRRGQVLSLVIARSVVGRFHRLPNGATYRLLCDGQSGIGPPVRINYTPRSVLATVR